MSTPISPAQWSKHATDGAWLVATRLATMAIGMIGLPILMSSLGALQFGAWAVLLGGTFAFGTLELGMSSSVARWSAMAATPNPEHGAASNSAIMTNALTTITLAYGFGGAILWARAEPLAEWLNLPTTPLLTPAQCILAVYSNVALTALLRSANVLLLSSQFVVTYSRITLIQALATALATWTVSVRSGRLDLVILVSIVTSVGVQTVAAVSVMRWIPWEYSWRYLDPGLMRRMLRHGSSLQFSDLASFVIFQFDKLLISSMVRPAEVAHFEVASRSAQAMGSLATTPFGAVPSLLSAQVGNRANLSEHAVRLLRMVLAGTGFFVMLPVAVAPIGMFAWVGQIGHHAAPVFALLALAIISTLLVLPFSICAQAMGRPGLELRRASLAMLANLPLSILLIRHYGKEGAALGTLLASLFANSLFAFAMLRVLGIGASGLYRELRSILIPILSVALLTKLAAHVIEPYVISSRWYMAPTTAFLLSAGALALAMILLRNDALTVEERRVIFDVPVLGRIMGWIAPRRPQEPMSAD